MDMILAPENKKNGDYYENPSLTVSLMKFDYEENGGKEKLF